MPTGTPPALSSLGADHIVPGWFLDQHLEQAPEGLRVDQGTAAELYRVVGAFSGAVTTAPGTHVVTVA